MSRGDLANFVDALALESIRTKAVVELLNGFDLGKNKTLIVLPEKDETLARSANNLPNVKTLNAMYLNVIDLLKYDNCGNPGVPAYDR